jgi:hypothetical protein
LSRTFTATPTTYTFSFWVKRGSIGVDQIVFGARTAGVGGAYIGFISDKLRFAPGNLAVIDTTSVYRDPSAWYHFVVSVINNGNVVIYSNGIQVLSTSAGASPYIFSSALTNTIGRNGDSASFYLDGYLTEVHFIDGQALTPASFGAIDSSTGVWAPSRYSGTYGTNGFYLKFANTSSVAALGNDSSGNNNTWTVNNVSLTAGVTYDSMIDVPVNYSDSGNGRGNYAVLNPLDKVTTATLAAANLETTSAAAQNIIGSMSMDSGSWYWEIAYSAATASQLVGVYKAAATTVSVTPTTNVIGLRFNADTGALDYTVNGSTYTSIATGLTGGGYFPYAGSLTNAKVIYANFGQRPFAYTPPAGFRALNTNNLPTPSIVNGANFMAATTYTGNAAARSLSNAVNNVSFQPDLVWIKSRTPGATNHALFDSSRGVTKYLSSNTTTAETTLAQSLTALNADGFSLGTDTTLVNASANSYVAWQWKAGGAAVSNTQGTITSQVSANTTAGFSVVTYTNQSTGVQTVGHGLGVAPKMIIVKFRGTTSNWFVYHSSIGNTGGVFLDTTSATNTNSTYWNNTSPSSSVFTLGTIWNSTATAAAYCFAEIAGFSKFGSYTGNGSADGPFVFCGFRPRFVMFKSSTGGTVDHNWVVFDSSRDTSNLSDLIISPNLSSIETTKGTSSNPCDILSNGFKIRGTGVASNTNGATYIFMAFAEMPSKYALAR